VTTLLLDTSTCVQILRAHEPALRRFARLGPDDVAISAVTVAELRYGELKGRTPSRARARLAAFLEPLEVLPFDAAAAEHHARTRLALAKAGTPIGERDLIIAATALAHALTVVTGNVREFRRVPALDVVDWGA
jgi:tRNA(fMet)-specific endonuclease VapC